MELNSSEFSVGNKRKEDRWAQFTGPTSSNELCRLQSESHLGLVCGPGTMAFSCCSSSNDRSKTMLGPLSWRNAGTSGHRVLLRWACPSLLSKNISEGQQNSLKFRIWALVTHTASGQRNAKLKGSNTHVHTIFFRSSCSVLRLKKT